jgi:hypothetical protein
VDSGAATKKTKPSRMTRALLETADGMRRIGVMDAATHEKIECRHLGDQASVRRVKGDLPQGQ